MSAHTPGPWRLDDVGDVESDAVHHIAVVFQSAIQEGWSGSDFSTLAHCEANARLISAAPEYHDAAFWIRQAVTNNATPVNSLAALEEMALNGEHITLDAGLVLDLLKAYAKAGGEA